MWQKYLGTIILFYLFALLQNSFFTHFSLFGAIPSLVFTLFFLLIFFQNKNLFYEVIFLAIVAGIFLDIFSYTYIGPSIVLLLIIGFLLKMSQSLLKNQKNKNPFIYFLPLFIIFFLVYNFSLGLYLHFIDPSRIAMPLGLETIFSVIYNAVIASAFFYLYKKFLELSVDDRQLKLFRK